MKLTINLLKIYIPIWLDLLCYLFCVIFALFIIIYIPIWLDLLLLYLPALIAHYIYLHSNMVRFIILKNKDIVKMAERFTFQYG